ncbi:MAG: hypothetical protein Terrestrivirus5_169 [Terrestrivirus sp.]|uniref:Uncharacterized protein n=1 Tax=Terrestrivirus sp. TaxID=2487775 RepID=A0A3G4ZN90_9VIRU|nr:MAG: hypothetical protein Terrestrivirus5_169 [Terrestrivirus sp.]
MTHNTDNRNNNYTDNSADNNDSDTCCNHCNSIHNCKQLSENINSDDKEFDYKINSIMEITNKCLTCDISTQYKRCLVNNTYLLSFILCDVCQSQNALYSKSFCINDLLLSKSDLDNIRCFHKGNTKLFLECDIRLLIKLKYGSESDYKDYKQNKIFQKYKKINNILQKREDRRKSLMEQLADHKLEFKTYGDCYTFIQFGYPELETVIKNELEKCKQMFIKYNVYKNCLFGKTENTSFISSYYFEDNYKNKFIEFDDEHSISSFF